MPNRLPATLLVPTRKRGQKLGNRGLFKPLARAKPGQRRGTTLSRQVVYRRFQVKRFLPFAALLLCGAVQAEEQPQGRVMIPSEGQGTITFYERPDFEGAAITFRQSETKVRVPFIPRSLRAEGIWRVCSSGNFGGRCVLVDSAHRDAQRKLGFMLTVGSVQAGDDAQAAAGVGYQGQGYGGQGYQSGWSGPIGGPSLRGVNVYFYAAPEIGRERIEACAGGGNYSGCAAATADRLCNYAGWPRAGSFGQQAIGRRTYLADVVCTNR
jgi:hypothetical protein